MNFVPCDARCIDQVSQKLVDRIKQHMAFLQTPSRECEQPAWTCKENMMQTNHCDSPISKNCENYQTGLFISYLAKQDQNCTF